MGKKYKFVIYWYSKIVFNSPNDPTKLFFRKLETETRKLTAENLYQKFNEICLKDNFLTTYTNINIYIYAVNTHLHW